MKRRVEAARARVQASAQQATPNRREAFSSSTSGRGAEKEEESEAGGREGSKNDELELAPPVPVVPAAAPAAPPQKVTEPQPLPLPAGVSLSELEGANKTVWTTLGEASGLGAWARKWSAAATRETGGGKGGEEEEEDSAANKKQAGSDWRETMSVFNRPLSLSVPLSLSLSAFHKLTLTRAVARIGDYLLPPQRHPRLCARGIGLLLLLTPSVNHAQLALGSLDPLVRDVDHYGNRRRSGRRQ